MFPALLDTNALFSATLSDTLLRCAEEELFRPLWSQDILDELQRILIREAGLTADKTQRRINRMQAAFPTAQVQGYESLIQAMSCDAKDRHVLAAAVKASAQVIVTFNVRDFPPSSVAAFGIGVVTPDSFLMDQLDLYPDRLRRAIDKQLKASRQPRLTKDELLSRLQRAGVPGFAQVLRAERFESM